jgi:hypothetical protein
MITITFNNSSDGPHGTWHFDVPEGMNQWRLKVDVNHHPCICIGDSIVVVGRSEEMRKSAQPHLLDTL